jgi:hypothetical protein
MVFKPISGFIFAVTNKNLNPAGSENMEENELGMRKELRPKPSEFLVSWSETSGPMRATRLTKDRIILTGATDRTRKAATSMDIRVYTGISLPDRKSLSVIGCGKQTSIGVLARPGGCDSLPFLRDTCRRLSRTCTPRGGAWQAKKWQKMRKNGGRFDFVITTIRTTDR